MSKPVAVAPQPADSTHADATSRSAASVGNVVFTLVLLSGILILIPPTRTVGLAFLVVLAIPAVVVWGRARRLTDGGRGLTTTTLVLGVGAFVLGSAFGSTPAPSPTTATAAPTVAPTPTTTASAPLVVVPPGVAVVPTPQSPVPAPPPVATPAPRVPVPAAPAPPPADEQPARSDQSGGAPYYQNCHAARRAGVAPLYVGEAGYRSALDRDNDGVACE